MLFLHYGASGIVRERKHEHRGLVGNSGLELFLCQAEIILFLGFDNNGNAAGHLRKRLVAHERGLRNKHLVSPVNKGSEGKVDSLAAAHGYKHLCFGYVA